jgi:hypothetical protein
MTKVLRDDIGVTKKAESKWNELPDFSFSYVQSGGCPIVQEWLLVFFFSQITFRVQYDLIKQVSNKIKAGIQKLELISYLYGVAILTHGGVQNTTISISSH